MSRDIDNKSYVNGPSSMPGERTLLKAIGDVLDDAGARQVDVTPELMAKYRAVVEEHLNSPNVRLASAAAKIVQKMLDYNLKRADTMDKIQKGGNASPQVITKVYTNTAPPVEEHGQ